MYEGKRGYVGTRLQMVFDAIKDGMFGDCEVVHHIIDSLCDGGDYYITCFDFVSYLEAQERVDETYRDYKLWTKMAILGLAASGKFSSDRTISEYCA